MSVTSRLTGKKHDGLLKEKGFTGFPSICAMDADGDVIAKLEGARDLPGLNRLMAAASKYETLRQQARSGDRASEQHLFVEDLRLGRYTYARACLRMAVLAPQLGPALTERARQALTDLLYSELTSQIRSQAQTIGRDAYLDAWYQLNQDFYASGQLPSGRAASSVLSAVIAKAQRAKDEKLMAACLAKYKELFGQDPTFGRRIETFEKQLDALRQK